MSFCYASRKLQVRKYENGACLKTWDSIEFIVNDLVRLLSSRQIASRILLSGEHSTLSRVIWFIFRFLKIFSFEALILNRKKCFFQRYFRKRQNRFCDSEIIFLFVNYCCAEKCSFEHKFCSIKLHVSNHFFLKVM